MVGSGKGSALRDLGLGESDERVYGALLRRRAAAALDAEQLRRELGITRGELERSLARLREHGFTLPEPEAAPGAGRPRAALPRPVPPAPAVRALIRRRQAELHYRAAELERLRREADEIAERLEPDPAGAPGAVAAVETVRGAAAVRHRLDHLLARAERQVLILDRPPGLDSWTADSRTADSWTAGGAPPGAGIAALLERGVAVRVVLARAGAAPPALLGPLAPLLERGLQVRTAAHLPTGLVAVDGRAALLLPGGDAEEDGTAVVVRGTLPRQVFGPLFEAHWGQALPLGDAARRPPEEHRDLLRLLAGGLKDEAIARRLGVHVHTARRRISRLLDDLDADTRFQAGAQAALRGWLAGP
ncbi:hypothetical protein FH965_08975 [Streptomyces spectabilis]|uniref:HTH luxR-type domain-containing protein n=2 Tax=Streptomyces spectabilis TaxID=68270 RepID=A0A516RKP3_STRST|nr:hypothetical protein FH965_08975 [Streptomyces spectabilis]